MARVFGVLFFLAVLIDCSTSNGGSWILTNPTSVSTFDPDDTITVTADGTGIGGYLYSVYGQTQRGVGTNNTGVIVVDTYASGSPPPFVNKSSAVSPTASGNGNHKSGSNVVSWVLNDYSTGGPQAVEWVTVTIN